MTDHQKKQQELANTLFSHISELAKIHSNQGIQTITPETRILDVFPTVTRKDEQANRFGRVIFESVMYFNQVLGENIELDYEPRTEFDLFETFGDLVQYFFGKITGLDKTMKELGLD
jgi:hypothetical protein